MKFIILVILVSISYQAQFESAIAADLFDYVRPTYCSQDKILAWNCPACQLHPNMQEIQVFFNVSHEAQGYCGYDPDANKIIIAIRGTVSQKNWLNDFDTIKTSYPECSGCKVHEGFYHVYEDLANNLLACSYTLHSNHPDAEIYVSGHSLGASQSTFAALEIDKNITPIQYLYNFGTPRVGNKAFADYLDNHFSHLYLARVIHWKDIFVHLPTSEMGFHHYGKQVFYDEDFNVFKECDSESRDCAFQFRWPWQWNLKDHLYYYRQCAGCFEEQCEQQL